MGIYTDIANGSDTIAPAAPRSGLDRASAQQLLSQAAKHDPTVGAAYAAQSEISTVDQLTGTPSAGTYTITVNFPVLGITYTTAGIAYNAAAATMEAALDTASPAAIADGDIAVTDSGTLGLSDGTATFTCAATAGSTPCLISVDNSGVTGIGGAQTTTRGTPGQTDRKATQILFEMNVVSGTLHNSGEAPSDWVKPESVGQSRARAGLIKDLALEIVKNEDGTDDVYTTVAALYDLP
jgi:hypothetical protein